MFKDVETWVSMFGIGNWIGSYLTCFSFLDIDRMARLSNGIWNWIGVYLRSLPNNKVLLFLKILKLKELNKV